MTLNEDERKKGIASLSLKLSLSTLSYAIRNLELLKPTAPFLVECEKIFCSLVRQSYKQKAFIKDKYPKFVVYMIQNFN